MNHPDDTKRKFNIWSKNLWIYALLIGGSLIFMWPFLWMIMASVKVDKELFSEDRRLLPATPTPMLQSPYVDTNLYRSLEHPAMEKVLPELQRILSERDNFWPDNIDGEAALPYLGRSVFRRLIQQVPSDWWQLPVDELMPRLEPILTDAFISQEAGSMTRSLVIGQLLVRSHDLEEEISITPDTIDQKWTIGGPAQAQFKEIKDLATQGRVLSYDFSEGNEVNLITRIKPEFDLDRLHRIQFFVRPDDTWHGIACEVFMKGKRYEAERVSTLSDNNWLALTWQEPGVDDQSNKKKEWILLNEKEKISPQTLASIYAVEGDQSSLLGQNDIVIRLTLKKRGLMGAWVAKIMRNYILVVDAIPFFRYVATSLFLVTLQIVGTIFSCSIVAYSFARLNWPGRSLCFLLMLATLMIPPQVVMIPQFLIMRELGWYNTLYPLWVPGLCANAFYVFLLYQFMKGIPRDLEDAARIDGCGALRIYWHVMMPLIRPSLAAIGIFTFMGVWNDFMGPLIYLSDQRLYPISLGLYALNVQSGIGAGSMGLMMAGSFLMTLPVILIFFFTQRYFIQGITLTGIKG